MLRWVCFRTIGDPHFIAVEDVIIPLFFAFQLHAAPQAQSIERLQSLFVDETPPSTEEFRVVLEETARVIH